MNASSDSDLCYLSASDALRAFRRKTLSPVELIDALIRRAEAVEPSINAFAFEHFGRAREQAQAAEARYAAGKATGALEGLAIGVKDESYIAGEPTSNGSLLLRDYVPDTTSANNERILAAGGIVHARTTTPEFSCAGYTWSRLWGVTRNPWNTEFTPGGSSGGTAASLSAGTSTLGTGSDIGGSIRIPASACGLVGYKPPYGRNPDDAPFNLDYYCHTGPLARTVEDAARLQNVMCGPHALDIASLRPKLTLPTEFEPIGDWKIAYSMNLGVFDVDPEVEQNTHRALDVFRSLGATVEEVDLKWDAGILDAGMGYLTHLFGSYLATHSAGREDELTTYARVLSEAARESSAADLLRSMDAACQMYATLGPLLERFNVFVCPTNALPAVAADFDQSKDAVTINGREVNPVLGWVMTTPFNMLSRCPVLSVPSGRAGNGVPTGIQIVGRTYCDLDVFQAGQAFETASGGWFTGGAARPEL